MSPLVRMMMLLVLALLLPGGSLLVPAYAVWRRRGQGSNIGTSRR